MKILRNICNTQDCSGMVLWRLVLVYRVFSTTDTSHIAFISLAFAIEESSYCVFTSRLIDRQLLLNIFTAYHLI